MVSPITVFAKTNFHETVRCVFRQCHGWQGVSLSATRLRPMKSGRNVITPATPLLPVERAWPSGVLGHSCPKDAMEVEHASWHGVKSHYLDMAPSGPLLRGFHQLLTISILSGFAQFAEIPSNCAKTANLQDHGPLEMADTETNVERDTTLGR